MMNRRKSEGFTIVEVLIVLAVAGLIMVVVFMTIPAMRRNARNNSRNKDASYIAAQRLQYNIENKVTASLPPGGYVCDPPTTSKLFCGYISKGMGYYDPDNVTFWANGSTMPTTIPTVTDPETIRTETFLKCNSTNTGAVTSGATWFDMVVLYAVESGSGPVSKCLHSTVTQTALVGNSSLFNN